MDRTLEPLALDSELIEAWFDNLICIIQLNLLLRRKIKYRFSLLWPARKRSFWLEHWRTLQNQQRYLMLIFENWWSTMRSHRTLKWQRESNFIVQSGGLVNLFVSTSWLYRSRQLNTLWKYNCETLSDWHNRRKIAGKTANRNESNVCKSQANVWMPRRYFDGYQNWELFMDSRAPRQSTKAGKCTSRGTIPKVNTNFGAASTKIPVQGTQAQKKYGFCMLCGGNHLRHDCKLRKATCYQYGRQGHISAVCQQK